MQEVPLAFDGGGQQNPASSLPPPQQKVMFFHCAFKGAALLTYLFSGFGSGYVVTFVMVTILSALDFWTVQKITGRLLVGLRWYNTIDEQGKSQWQFMSFEDQRVINPTESNVFWIGLFSAPGIWILLGLSTVLTLRFMWLVLVLVALGLNMMNVVGYVKCKRDAGKKLSAIGGTVFTRGLEFAANARGAAERMRGGAGERVPTSDP